MLRFFSISVSADALLLVIGSWLLILHPNIISAEMVSRQPVVLGVVLRVPMLGHSHTLMPFTGIV